MSLCKACDQCGHNYYDPCPKIEKKEFSQSCMVFNLSQLEDCEM